MHFRSKSAVITLLLAFWLVPGHPQLFSDYNFNFKTYTTTNGLVHNSVKKCMSDSKGFLWIITENGLSRFDGYQFKNYKNDIHDSTSLPVNDLWDIAITGNDEIFLAYKFGLCCMNPLTGVFSVIRYKGGNIQALKLSYHKQTNTLYIATHNGILRFNTSNRQVSTTSLTSAFQNTVTNLFIDKHNYLWAMIERNGYYRYDISRDTSYYYNSYDWPMHLYQDNNGTYYMGTWGSGFQVFQDIGQEQKKEQFNLKLSDVAGDNYIFCGATEAPLLTGNDIVWVVGHTSGVGLFSKSQKKFIKHYGYNPSLKNGISTTFNWSIYTAPDGNLWICTWHGIMKVNPQDQYFQSAELPELHSALYNAVTGIIDDPYDNNTAWMAVLGNGIARYDKSKNSISRRYYSDNENGSVSYMERWPVYFYKDSNHVIWSGSYGGLIKISKGQVSFVPVTDSGRQLFAESFAMDSKDNIWLAGRYLMQFNPYTGKTTSWKFPWIHHSNFYGYGITETPDSKMYIASEWGLFAVNTETGKTEQVHYTIPSADSAKWSKVYSVKAIGDNIYFGTSAGLAAYNTLTKKTEVIGAGKNLSPVLKNALYRDNRNNLWIYCSSGLFRYVPATNELVQFTTADGVYTHSNDPAYFFEYNGNTYLGSRMAYTRFNPSYISNNKNKPVPYITAAVLAGSPGLEQSITEGCRLNHKQQNISFDYTAIEYNFPEKITFAVLLEGFDKDWTPASSARTKSYTNLPPGNYTFKVKAYNNNRQGDAVASFHFRINPAFWQTAWFKILVALFSAFLVSLLYRIRVRQIKKHQREKYKVQQLELEKYKQQLEMEQIISYFTSSLSGKETQEEIIWDVAKNLIQKLGFKDCIIYLWNGDKTLLLQKAGYDQTGALGETNKPEFTVKPWQGIVGHVAATKKPILIGDTSADSRYRPDALVRGSELCVPALYGDELVSIIDSEDYEKNYYTQQHLQILTTIATLMAAKLVSARAADEARRKKEELSELNSQMVEKEIEKYKQELEAEQITSFFSGSLVGKESITEVLTDVAKNLIGKMGFEDCMIYLWDDAKTKLVQHAGHGVKGAIENTADKERYHIPAGKGIVGATVESRQPQLINDTSADPRYISADGIVRLSELCVPVLLDDHVIGAINIEHSHRNYFTKHHLQTVSTIAALMASKIKAIESNKALHQKQLELAHTSRQLAEREIAMLRSQMNPHFIFNSLNSVQKYIWENKEEDAAEYLASFAKLMRSILENSRHEFISLKKESEFLKLYIDLEYRRSNSSFNYTIKTDETLDPEKILIPPMLLQPFIENAIWHGLNRKTEKGNLLVNIFQEKNNLVCVVDDDGVGRPPEAEKAGVKKSLGISITRQRIERLTEITGSNASLHIKDKMMNGVPAGTEVTVILPIQYIQDHA